MRRDLRPDQVVLDLVLEHVPAMPGPGQAAMFGPTLVITAHNHLGQVVSLGVPISPDGDPVEGPDPRFVLRRLGATVWKLAPSVMHPLLHAYVTIVGVPEDVTWWH